MKHFDPAKPSDVRKFALEISRLMQSGPAGKVQAKRLLSESNKDLVKKARDYAKILSESTKVDVSNLKVKVDSASDQAAKQLGAQAFTTGQGIFIGGGVSASGTSMETDIVAHEVAHVLQQSNKK